jgi:UDP-glucose 4-epimerase
MKKNINVLFGERSNLSLSLSLVLNNAILLSGGDAQELLKYHDKDVRINVVINSFQRSTELGDFSNPKQYTEKTLGDLSNIIDVLINIKDLIGTVIYTSSAAVYGRNSCCHEKDQVHPSSLYSSLKISSEMMIQNYLSAHGINYIIARVFNMYGGNDNFSIISKMIASHAGDGELHLFNNGESVRDFIHILDVCNIYNKLLESDYCGTVNVGTGSGHSIKNIVEMLKDYSVDFKINSKIRDEINESIASTTILRSIIKRYNFIDLNDYFVKEIAL